MRTYEESMLIIERALDRYPGTCSASATFTVERTPGGSWWAHVRLWLPMGPNIERRQKISLETRSCEMDKLLDSLASEIESTLELHREATTS